MSRSISGWSRNSYNAFTLLTFTAAIAWTRLCQIKDLSKEEWVAQAEVEGEDEEDEVEEQEVAGEGYEGDEEDVTHYKRCITKGQK